VRAEALALHDLSAAVSLSITTPGFEGSLGGALLVAPPGHLRLRATKVMQDVFDLVVAPDELDLYWFRDRTFFRRRLDGAAPAATPPAGGAKEGPERFLAQLDGRAMRLSLANFELPRAGEESPLPPSDRVVEESSGREGGRFIVRARLAGGDRVERRFDGRSLLLDEVLLFGGDGKPRLRATYGDYGPVGPSWLARSMALADLATGVTFEMELDDVAINEGVLPGAFALAPPPGVEVRDL
jgi:hypothetical protein